ncbi:MAG: leucine--tRNA ligase, partial [Silvanigrellaceae bacterium]|nr:leucine--tRNA ligase [Silvanigrellaceae bacterium]
MAYKPQEIEKKWQSLWEKCHTFKTGEDRQKKKYYALDMFPYPSAAGLHVGHPLGYTGTDIVARYYRMKGYNVLHPIGWDAFGLPAEQHAIDTGEHPSKVTYRSIENFKKQLKSLGFSYDWEKEVATCDSKYYHWTQWIFTLLCQRGLAYQAEILVNWCPGLKTVLANEEIVDGKSERGGYPVYRTPMKQWMLKITDYAERLLVDLDKLDWPESTKEIQRNWIGKSTGAKIKFIIDKQQDVEKYIEVFTTLPYTIFGVSFLVLAPEHPLAKEISSAKVKEQIDNYLNQISQKSDLERTELNKDKTGVSIDAFALHPLTGKKIPIWISDYVMMNYGTGAVMGVPALDERDQAFAKNFGIEILPVKETMQETDTIIAALEEKNLGKRHTTYKLRDWVFSRQRYWGEPIPVLKKSNGEFLRTLQENELPLTLPEVESYEPTGDGRSPLAAMQNWVERKKSQGESEFLETDTMPGSAGSSWYFIRYVDPLNTQSMASFEKLKYWLPVDLYVGGQEHAVGHLLYARFWTKVLYDAGLCPVDEPFQKLVHQGMICRDGAKMSRSKGNGVNPDEVVNSFGADTLRVY